MRKVLATVSVVLLITLAGCVDPESTIEMNEMNSEIQVANNATTDSTVLAEPLKKTIVNGESNRTDYNYLDSDDNIRHNGSVYSIEGHKVGERSAVEFEYNISKSNRSSDVNFETLIEEDQQTIRSGVRKIQDRENRREILFGNTYSLDVNNKSKILENNTTIIKYKNTSYKFKVNDKRVIKEDIYKYRRKLVSNSLESYGQEIIDKHAFNISFSNQEQREFINKSIDDNYYGEQNKTVENIIKQFDSEKAFELKEYRGTWFVRYNEQLYEAELSWRGDI
jgi:hypothetical protein